MKKLDVPEYMPDTPWVYKFLWTKGKILYIWKAKNLKNRISQYFTPGSVWKQDMIYSARTIERIETATEEDALLLEEDLIKMYLPDYNRLLKHNSNYVYLKFTNEDFPKVEIVRKRKQDWATYIWPKQRSRLFYRSLKYIRRILKWRTMTKNQFVKWIIDMDFHLKLDEGRSIINIIDTDEWKSLAMKNWINTKISRDEWRNDYLRRLAILSEYIKWNTKKLLLEIQNDITKHSDAQNFEWCQQLTEIYWYINESSNAQHTIVLNRTWTGIFVSIYKEKNNSVIVVLKLFEWRIIDVVTEKYTNDERDMSGIVVSLEKEFEVILMESLNDKFILYTATKNNLLKKHITQLLLFSDWVFSSYISSHAFEKDSVMSSMLKEMKIRYRLESIPYHIECLDISHFWWEDASWWLSALINWLPFSKWYRHYKISKENAWDDYASLKEVLVRRFKLKVKSIDPNLMMPDLFIIDGWKWQLWIVKELEKEFPLLRDIISNWVQFVALWKWKARTRKWKSDWFVESIYLFNEDDIMSIPLTYDTIDQLLIKCRDEAHRFANRYRKKQFKKSYLKKS